MGKAMVLLALLFSLACVTVAQSDTLTLRRPDGSTYEMEGDVKHYEDNKFVVVLRSGGKMSLSLEQVQTINVPEASAEKVSPWDRLTVRKDDGSAYVFVGRVKSYEDNKFAVVSSSGEQETFPIDQVQLIEFGEKKKRYSPSRKTKTRTRATRRRVGDFDFRGIKWGTNISTLDDMEYYATDPSYGGIKIYTRNNDDLHIGGAKIKRIEYKFWRGEFCSVVIYTEGYVNYSGLKEATFKKFGRGYQSNEYIERYFWHDSSVSPWPQGKKTNMLLKYNEISEDGSLYISSKDIAKQMEAYEKQKAKEGAEKGF